MSQSTQDDLFPAMKLSLEKINRIVEQPTPLDMGDKMAIRTLIVQAGIVRKKRK